MKKIIKSVVRKVAKRVLGTEVILNDSTWSGYTRDALQLARIIDCAPEHLRTPQQHPERIAAKIQDRVCNWYLPQFDSPFYGGVMTILRLAESLQRLQGMQQRFLICGDASASEMKAKVVSAFPTLEQAEVIVLNSAKAINEIPASDYSVATLWTTAYVLLGVQNTGYKFYMIQDFEPAFYPAGSTYAQAELTYHFGFYGICNTQTLKEIYERDYGGCAVILQPSIDQTVFYPAKEERPAAPKRLFYYARPGTPRNGFELAAAALTRLKQEQGDRVEIICAGTGWNPEQYGLGGMVTSVGMLPYAATGDLYRSCHVGFVMMMTKHPSYLPFELMACGSTVMTNYNAANTWLLKDGENCFLAPPTASNIAATLAYALDHYEETAAIRENAAHHIRNTLSGWDASLGAVADFMLNPPASFQGRTPFGLKFSAAKSV